MRRHPRLIFIHIPKTAGTALVDAIGREYGVENVVRLYLDETGVPLEEFLEWPRRRQRRVRAVVGHLYFGLAACLPGPSTYLTLLREPVDRIVSHHSYVLSLPVLVEMHQAYGPDRSLEAHVTRSPIRHLVNDAMTRQLGGAVLDDRMPPTNAHFERAIQRIDEEIAVVGIWERLEESVALMRDVFGWAETHVPVLNVTPSRPSVTDIDPRDRAIIEEHNQRDIALYAHARARFDELLAKRVTTSR